MLFLCLGYSHPIAVKLNVSNIGDLRTLVIHPASTLYLRSGREETEAAGVFDDTVRVSVGIEDKEDLINDFISAVAKSRI